MDRSLEDLLKRSEEILFKAIKDFKPDAIVSMVSGGNDSAVADRVLRELGVIPDFIMHGNTRTGIRQTTEFVRAKYQDSGGKYIEADAGTAFEDYVLRKGFFGKGQRAHTYCYHVIKAGPFRKALSEHIRQRRHNIKILLINGARVSESDNRAKSKPDVYNFDPSQKGNIWVNIIHHWTKHDCNRYIQSRCIDQNPVTKKMCRSGECLCGTQQTKEELAEAEILYPEWGEWRRDLNRRVIANGFPWKHGQHISEHHILEKHGQQRIEFDGFQPMCVDCNNVTSKTESGHVIVATKKILDACCGSRMFWFDKENEDVLFADIRDEEYTLCDGRDLEISPDMQVDFRDMPFEDNSFKMVVFDPPHLKDLGKSSWMAKKYGRLFPSWKDDIAQGFKECFRVLEPNGTLIFKWNETQIKVSEILELTDYEPLFGHKSGKQANTHWIAFMKTR